MKIEYNILFTNKWINGINQLDFKIIFEMLYQLQIKRLN